MLRLSRKQGWRGAGALGFVLLQLVAAAALPSADAVLEAERAALPIHVESPQSESCPSSHDHVFCQVVRSLASVSETRGVGALLVLAPRVTEGVTRAAHGGTELRPPVRGPLAPRPPPLG